MARRWQRSLWVLLGLVLAVAALWDSATVSAVSDRVGERTEAVGGSDQRGPDAPAPSDLAFTDLDGDGLDDGNSNMLRPTSTTTTTTTTTTRPTTTSSTVEGEPGVDDGKDPGSATTSPIGGDDGEPDEDGSLGTNPTGPVAPTTPIIDRPSPASTPPPEQAMTMVYFEDFSSGAVAADGWEVFDSVGHSGWGVRSPSAVTVAAEPDAAGGHTLRITANMGSGGNADRVVTGGIKLLGHSMTYGRYSFRARVDADPAEVTSGVVSLWPADNVWPDGGEINIMETWANRSTRAPVESNLHWPLDGQGTFVGVTHSTASGPVSAAEWHVYTLDWTQTNVTISIDGGRPVVLSTEADRIPHRPMDLTVQLEALDHPSAPGHQPMMEDDVTLMVDWIRIERPVHQAGH